MNPGDLLRNLRAVNVSGKQGANSTQRAEPGRRLIHVMWILLAVILLVLVGMAGVLFIRLGVFSKNHLTSEESKDLWTFLGVSIGAAVTLIGTMLTEQYRQNQQALARESAQRQKIDTVAKVLKLITVGRYYAPRARVAGAITTLIDLQSGQVGLRILGELWADDRVDSETAVWLVDQVLRDEESSVDEKQLAAYLLARRAQTLVPAPKDSEQGRYLWPTALSRPWSGNLPGNAKRTLVIFVVKLLLAREIAWWQERKLTEPIDALLMALDQQESAQRAAHMLNTLHLSGALNRIGFPVDDHLIKTIGEKAGSAVVSKYVEGFIHELKDWARGAQPKEVSHPATGQFPRQQTDTHPAVIAAANRHASRHSRPGITVTASPEDDRGN